MRRSSIAVLALGALALGVCMRLQALDGQGRRGPESRSARIGAIEEASTQARLQRPVTAASDPECPVVRRVPARSGEVEGPAPTAVARAEDRRARLIGRLHRGDELADPATTLEILTGPDRGTLLPLEEDGSFASLPLAAERITLAIRSPRGAFERSLDLRIGRPTVLSLDLGAGRPIGGRVLDEAGAPVRGAQVLVDGDGTRTDGLGGFIASTRASGVAAVQVEAPGFARAELPLGEDEGAIAVRLRRAGRLEIALAEATEDLEVRVGPHRTGRPEHDSFPWHRVEPHAPDATGVVVFEGLPADWVHIEASDANGRRFTKLTRIAPGRTVRESLSVTTSALGVAP